MNSQQVNRGIIIAYIAGAVMTFGVAFQDSKTRLCGAMPDLPASCIIVSVSGGVVAGMAWPLYWSARLAE